ncbi:diadenosine tetraphosphate (Ap4A) HIT family hydrolase [Psychromicrobium silvestre]|uniref:Diadenosine tetraphosphate (Ap4A) HIT family hydrolase n=1 Tax=Psychromicrobium silvestre TaxID=1645614 RepID=A0A7Y9LSL3_9MICC|nr:HIT family protein [Psychromicrobium silvestre]NYE94832.1 diadenosine tetraphosphate (Ap4A) HIT family hydrolase [Psychromicrobium silvestre]
MPTLFSRIIDGELPGRFVWKDEDVVVFLTIAPLADGHVLVVPRQVVNRWTDASPELMHKLSSVAQTIGQAQIEAFSSARAGLIIAGFEVEHLHLHVWPSNSMAEYNFASVDNNPDSEKLDASAEKLRKALRAAGHGEFVPAS